jgi:hypothetical protein
MMARNYVLACLSVLVGVSFNGLPTMAFGFSPMTQKGFGQIKQMKYKQMVPAFALLASPDPEESEASTDSDDTKSRLAEKMASWEASEEELRNASLGGLIPGKANRIDGFDLGLWILFPLMVGTAAILLFLPLFIDQIDINSVGPPPTS